MNLTRINYGVVVSDAGFQVRLDHASVIYTEGGRMTHVPSEIETNPINRIVYGARPLRWLPPHEAEPIDGARQAQILAAVHAALAFIGSRSRLRLNDSLDIQCKACGSG